MLKLIFLICLIYVGLSQAPPESVKITNLPNMTQDFYQGWISVDNQTESYLYYQLFSADGTNVNTSSQIPLLLYLEGGPCDSSTLTTWSDFGPYGVNSNLNVSGPNNPYDIEFTVFKRNLTWSGPYHILSVDSPVFTGFSYSATGEMVNDTETAAEHLINFLGRFYQLYNQLLSSPLYILGHSYGGHWVPALAYSLVKDYNLTLLDNEKITLGGVVLLNTIVSAKRQVGQAGYFLSAGVTDSNQRDFINSFDSQLLSQLSSPDQLINASETYSKEQGYLLNLVTGVQLTTNVSLDNIRRNHLPGSPSSLVLLEYITSPLTYFNLSFAPVPSARTLLNIPPNVNFLEGYCTAGFVLSGDVATDYVYAVEYLLDQGFDVTFLAAQDDGTVLLPGIVNLVSSLNWTYAQDFKNTLRNVWFSQKDNVSVLGAFKKYINLNLVTLYKSGHLITFDQPEAMFEFMNLTTSHKWQ